MNVNKEITLGFTKPVKKEQGDAYQSEDDDEFPSVIGGQPIWLNRQGAPEEVICQECGEQMAFLLQLYSPLSGNAYYRCIYLFQCLNTKCQNKLNQIRVFRTQFGKGQKISQNAVQGNLQKNLEKQFKILPDNESIKEGKEIQIKCQEILNSLNVADSDLSLYKNSKPQDFEKEFELAKQYAQTMQPNELKNQKNKSKSQASSVNSSFAEDSDEEDVHRDRAFTLYEAYMNELGQHAIRFCRHKSSLPLWYGDKNQWTIKDIPKCKHCGSQKIFEFQINNSILNLYQELIANDWGIGVIYTCQNSCDVKDQLYVEETIKLQVGTEDPLTEKEIQEKINQLNLDDEILKELNEKMDEMEGKKPVDQEEEEKKCDGDEQQQQEENNNTEQKPKKSKKKKNKQKEEPKQEEEKQEEEEDDW